MTNPEVDRISSVYARYRADAAAQAQWSLANAGNQAIVRERSDCLRRLLEQEDLLPLTDKHILDVGCGAGHVLAALEEWEGTPGRMVGVDLLDERIEAARRQYPELSFVQANAEALPFEDQRFDLVLLFTVFTSILDDSMARNVASEVMRVLKPGGAIAWYDFRYDNPRNPNVRGRSRRDVESLFPGFRMRLQLVTLLPPLSRRLGSHTRYLYPLLSLFPPLRTHYVGVLRKPE